MNKTMTRAVLFPAFAAALAMTSACSNDEAQEEQEMDNVLQHQIDAMDKAKEVEGMLEEVDKQRREQAME